MIKSPFVFTVAVFVFLLFSGISLPTAASAGEEALKLTGYTAVEGRFFMQTPAHQDQEYGPQLSWAIQPELSLDAAGARHQFKLTPFVRIDGMDEERSHFDLREAYWRYTSESWEVLAGLNKVFWGVAESRHLVDIINQSDLLEDVDQEDKLGQPMIMAAGLFTWGELQFYLLPFFREIRYPGEKGRLRPPLTVDDDSEFQSGTEEKHIDAALRYSHYFGDWDVGASYFNGTSREPRLILNDRMDQLTPYYELIRQFGVDFQYTREAWLWKFEGIYREGRDDSFVATVGGFEWTLYQVMQSNADLGWLLEYNWDGRDNAESPPTSYDNDLFAGMRLALNDPQDTSALVGAVVDSKTGSKFVSLEAERRIIGAFILEVQARLFIDIDDQDPVKSIEDDDFVNVSLQYHF